MTSPNEPVDVLVVGFGPVGATMAGLAQRHGLSVLAVDRETELFPLPRAAHCDHEVLRILQELGCAEEIVAGVVVNDGMDFLDASGQVLLSLCAPEQARLGWPPSVLFHQPTFEGVLRRAVVERGVTTRLGREVVALADRGELVVATLEDGSTVEARVVVGCDGAQSTVRKLVGATLEDFGFEEPWLVMDLLVDGPVEGLPGRAWQVCDPARPTTLVPMPPPRFRFEFMALPEEDPADLLDGDRQRALLARWIDPDRVTVERAAVYTFHGLVARSWRSGRVFLAGDAAHQMPPFLGQGMCSGMRDAANLAWKLAAVLRDGAPGSLLDTYQAERDPHVRAIIDAAIGFGRIICTTDPIVAAERDEGFRMSPSRQEVAGMPDLAGGPGFGPGGGAMSPQPRVGGVPVDELIGPRFGVVTAEPIPDGDPDRSWWEERATVLDTRTHRQLGVLLEGASAVVIRPDRYVFGSGTLGELTEAARALLDPREAVTPSR